MVNADELEKLLIETNYDSKLTQTIVNGFRHGFDLGYRGREDIQMSSPNLRFSIGNDKIVWEKMMKEVELKRYTGPFNYIPYYHYILSPVGLVPKDGGKKTRLIFHLSYPRDQGTSVNANTPSELCSVQYKNFEEAVRLCLRVGKACFAGKSDFSSAFRHLPINKHFWRYLVMKAKNPRTRKWCFFVDKCLLFGLSCSCAIFQMFSDCIAHIMRIKTGYENLNYLDDFFLLRIGKENKIESLNLNSFISFN